MAFPLMKKNDVFSTFLIPNKLVAKTHSFVVYFLPCVFLMVCIMDCNRVVLVGTSFYEMKSWEYRNNVLLL